MLVDGEPVVSVRVACETAHIDVDALGADEEEAGRAVIPPHLEQ